MRGDPPIFNSAFKTTDEAISHLTRLLKNASQVIGYALDITALRSNSKSSCANQHIPVFHFRALCSVIARYIFNTLFQPTARHESGVAQLLKIFMCKPAHSGFSFHARLARLSLATVVKLSKHTLQ